MIKSLRLNPSKIVNFILVYILAVSLVSVFFKIFDLQRSNIYNSFLQKQYKDLVNFNSISLGESDDKRDR